MEKQLTTRVIVTGADGMGKTTLIDALVMNYRFQFLGHEGGPVRDRADAVQRVASILFAPPGLQDRSCLVDDPVYSTVFKREPVVHWPMYDEILLAFQPLIIFVDTDQPNISPVAKAHKSEELLNAVIDNRSDIRKEYYNRINKLRDLGLTVISYDWTHDPTAKKLIKRLERGGFVCAAC